MARKTVLVCDNCGSEVGEGKGATLRLNYTDLDFLLDGVVNQVARHAIVHAPDTTLDEIVVRFIDLLRLAAGLLDRDPFGLGWIHVHEPLRLDHSRHEAVR